MKLKMIWLFLFAYLVNFLFGHAIYSILGLEGFKPFGVDLLDSLVQGIITTGVIYGISWFFITWREGARKKRKATRKKTKTTKGKKKERKGKK